MNSERAKDCTSKQKEFKRMRRFNRSQDKDSVSLPRRQLSECSSDTSLFRFCQPGPKGIKTAKFLDEVSSQIPAQNDVNNLIYQSKKKPKTMTSKFQYQNVTTQVNSNFTLIQLVKQLRTRNVQLENKVTELSKFVNQDLNKQNKPMNKLRDRTQKQRIKELELENHHLKQTIEHLSSELKEVQSSRLSEETNYSLMDNTMELEDQLANSQKQIFSLTQELRKTRIEMDFINRRNYSEIISLKNNYEKELKGLRDKIQDLVKQSSQLKRKNNELVCIIKGTREKKTNRSNSRKNQYAQSLLQLSCSD